MVQEIAKNWSMGKKEEAQDLISSLERREYQVLRGSRQGRFVQLSPFEETTAMISHLSL